MQIEPIQSIEEERQPKEMESQPDEGVDSQNFQLMRQSEFYVDKSLFIKEVFSKYNISILITRPRRWGKSLNANMLQTFLQPSGFNFKYYHDYLGNQYNFKLGNESRHLFEGLVISKHKIYMDEYLGQYPVIYISFKDVYGITMEIVKEKFKNIVIEVLKQHKYLYLHLMLSVINKFIHEWKDDVQLQEWKQKKWVDNNQINFEKIFKNVDYQQLVIEVQDVFFHPLNKFDKKIFDPQRKSLFELFQGSIKDNYANSLLFIAEYLSSFFQKDRTKINEQNIVIIIDECDNGLTTAQMEEIKQDQSQVQNNLEIKNFIKHQCKDILGIFSKEKFFIKKIIVFGIEQFLILSASGGYNDILQFPITSKGFEGCFAFSEKEIDYLLDILKGTVNKIKPLSQQQVDQVKQNIVEWYNGYNIFEQKIYNPNSVYKYLSLVKAELLKQKQIPIPQSYWVRSGTNEILFLLTNKNRSLDRCLGEKLLQLCGGNQIELDFDEDFIFSGFINEQRISENMISSLFVNTGYLTFDSNNKNYFRIPNKEIQKHMVQQLNLYKYELFNIVNQKIFVTNFMKSFTDTNEFQESIQQLLNKLELKFEVSEFYFVCMIQGIFMEADRLNVQRFLAIPEQIQSFQKRADHVFYPIEGGKDNCVYIHEYKISTSSEKQETKIQDAIWQVYGNFYISNIINEIEQNKLTKIKFVSVRIIVFTKFQTDEKWHNFIKEFKHSINQAIELRNIFTKEGLLLDKHQQFYSGSQDIQNKRRTKFLQQTKFTDINSLLEKYATSEQTSEGKDEVQSKKEVQTVVKAIKKREDEVQSKKDVQTVVKAIKKNKKNKKK